MAKKVTKNTAQKTSDSTGFFNSKQNQFILSLLLMLVSILIIIAFVSYFQSWKADQSIISELVDKKITAKNIAGKIALLQSRILLEIFYFTFFAPFAVYFTFFKDHLNIKNFMEKI